MLKNKLSARRSRTVLMETAGRVVVLVLVASCAPNSGQATGHGRKRDRQPRIAQGGGGVHGGGLVARAAAGRVFLNAERARRGIGVRFRPCQFVMCATCSFVTHAASERKAASRIEAAATVAGHGQHAVRSSDRGRDRERAARQEL